MTYTRPFITRRFVAHGADSHRRRLSLAVEVGDTFTEELIGVPLRVFLAQARHARTLLGLSGRYCFENLPDGDYTLVVELDPANDWYYLHPEKPGEWKDGFERPVKLPPPGHDAPGSKGPLVKLSLAPKPSYPFPANATLLRGKVTTNDEPPAAVPGAVVKSTYRQADPAALDDPTQTVPADIETQTDAAGEYVLFFKKLPGKTQKIKVLADKGSKHDELELTITEGATLFADPLRLK